MQKRYGIFYFFLLLTGLAHAQHEQQYTQFMFNKLGYNPAAAGLFESPTLTAVYRSQWMGLEGAPNTQLLSYSMPVFGNRVGLGGNLVRNSIGITRTVSLEVAYAYRIPLKRGSLGIGLQPSIRQFYQNWNDPRLQATQPIPTDNSIPAGVQSKVLPNVGFGAYYSSQRRGREQWYVGIAAPRLVMNNIDFSDVGRVTSREVLHLNVMTGYNFKLNDFSTFSTQLLLKYALNAPLDADINVSTMLKEKFYGGLTYRTGGDTNNGGESVDVLLGMQATTNLFFCLSYDIGLTRLRKFNNGSVEATVRWWFNPPEGTPEKMSKPNL